MHLVSLLIAAAAPAFAAMVPVYEYFNGENAFFTTIPSIPGTNWNLVKKAFCVSAVPGGSFTSFQYWWKNKGNGRSNNFYTANKSELANGSDPAIGTPDRMNYGYSFQGILGYISTVQGNGMVPLLRAYKHGDDKHYFTINPPEQTTGQRTISPFDNGGYGVEAPAGFVWPPQFC